MEIEHLSGTTLDNKTIYKLHGALPTERLETLIYMEHVMKNLTDEATETLVDVINNICNVQDLIDGVEGTLQVARDMEVELRRMVDDKGIAKLDGEEVLKCMEDYLQELEDRLDPIKETLETLAEIDNDLEYVYSEVSITLNKIEETLENANR